MPGGRSTPIHSKGLRLQKGRKFPKFQFSSLKICYFSQFSSSLVVFLGAKSSFICKPVLWVEVGIVEMKASDSAFVGGNARQKEASREVKCSLFPFSKFEENQRCVPQEVHGPCIKNNLNPAWMCRITVPVKIPSVADTIRLSLYDNDFFQNGAPPSLATWPGVACGFSTGWTRPSCD